LQKRKFFCLHEHQAQSRKLNFFNDEILKKLTNHPFIFGQGFSSFFAKLLAFLMIFHSFEING